jgi:hypothetical protein
MDRISTAVVVYKHVRAQIETEYPDLDDQTLQDTLEGLTDLDEVLRELIRSALDDEALVAGLSTRIADMKTRLDRLKSRAFKKRDMVARAMKDANFKRLAAPDFTASLRQRPAPLLITSEPEIPEAYWLPQPPKLDRAGLMADLKAGRTIDGVTLGEPDHSITIRTN